MRDFSRSAIAMVAQLDRGHGIEWGGRHRVGDRSAGLQEYHLPEDPEDPKMTPPQV